MAGRAGDRDQRDPTIPLLFITSARSPAKFYLCAATADALDISPATLRRLGPRDPDRFGPSHEAFYGRVQMIALRAGADDVIRFHGEHLIVAIPPNRNVEIFYGNRVVTSAYVTVSPAVSHTARGIGARSIRPLTSREQDESD